MSNSNVKRMSSRVSFWIGRTAVSAVVLASGLGGCPAMNMNGDGGGGTTTSSVSIRGFSYSPREITVPVGTTVTWTNRDAVVHTVTSGDPGDADAGAAFNGSLAPGGSFEHTFDTAGEFVYFCIPHQSMASMRGAKVIVTE